EPHGDSPVADAIAELTQTVSLFDLRHAGLALSTSLASTLNLLLLGLLLHRRLGALGGRVLLPALAPTFVAAVAMVPAVPSVAGITDWSQHGQVTAHVLVLLAAIAVGVCVFAFVAMILGGEEIQLLARMRRQHPASAKPTMQGDGKTVGQAR